MPVYNAEAWLTRALDSLGSQTYENIEVICVDNNSTDASKSIIKDFAAADPRFKYLFESKPGSGHSRETGLAAATGEYLMFCDADDWYEINAVELMTTVIESGSDLAVCDCHVVGDSASAASNYQYMCTPPHALPAGTDNLTQWDKFHINKVLWNKIFKMEIVRRHALRFTSGPQDDASFVLQYLAHARSMRHLNIPLYNYFQHGDSQSDLRFTGRKCNGFLRVFGETCEFLKSQGLKLEDQDFMLVELIYSMDHKSLNTVRTIELLEFLKTELKPTLGAAVVERWRLGELITRPQNILAQGQNLYLGQVEGQSRHDYIGMHVHYHHLAAHFVKCAATTPTC